MKLVKAAYEALGTKYLDYRRGLRSERYVRQLCQYLRPRDRILDVGCGLGVPVDEELVKAGFEVTGIDLVPSYIAEARRRVPGAAFEVRDMRELGVGEYAVEAVVCLYALFHVPRSEHAKMLTTFASFLPKNGMLLLSLGDVAFEGEHEMYGVKSYSSQYGRAQNRRLVEGGGLQVISEEIALSGGERHQMILARKS